MAVNELGPTVKFRETGVTINRDDNTLNFTFVGEATDTDGVKRVVSGSYGFGDGTTAEDAVNAAVTDVNSVEIL